MLICSSTKFRKAFVFVCFLSNISTHKVMSAKAVHQQIRSLVQHRWTVFISTYCDNPNHVGQATYKLEVWHRTNSFNLRNVNDIPSCTICRDVYDLLLFDLNLQATAIPVGRHIVLLPTQKLRYQELRTFQGRHFTHSFRDLL
jgi:hypothetical protein